MRIIKYLAVVLVAAFVLAGAADASSIYSANTTADHSVSTQLVNIVNENKAAVNQQLNH